MSILVLLTVAILSVIWINSVEIALIMFRLPVIVSAILGFIGTWLLYKSAKGPFTEKKTIALTVNVGMVVLSSAVVFINLIDG